MHTLLGISGSRRRVLLNQAFFSQSQINFSFGIFAALVFRAYKPRSIIRAHGLYTPCALLLADDPILAGLAVLTGIAKEECFAPHVRARARTASS